MPHLYTLTGNLLAETTATYESVTWNQTHRAIEENFQVGGKGINVAKMAQRLGLPTTAVCFAGGDTGARCQKWLSGQPFAAQVFPQHTETRSGWVVRDVAGRETTFLGRDSPIEEDAWKQAVNFLARELNSGDALAISGSVPGWRNSLAALFGRFLEDVAKDVFIAVDTYGAPLDALARFPIDLLKVNREELQTLYPASENQESVSEALGVLSQKYPLIKRWVITTGEGPVTALEHGSSPFSIAPPSVDVVSAVGCGDVLFAGMLHALIAEKQSLRGALEESLPLAAANAASSGIADFEL